MTGEQFQDTSVEKKISATQKQLLEGALRGEGVSRPLMVGGQPAEEGMTFENARNELYQLIDAGFIELDNKWQPKLTDKGIEALASL